MGVPNGGVAQRMRNILQTDSKDNEAAAAANEAQQRCWLRGHAISRRREGGADKGKEREEGRKIRGKREDKRGQREGEMECVCERVEEINICFDAQLFKCLIMFKLFDCWSSLWM